MVDVFPIFFIFCANVFLLYLSKCIITDTEYFQLNSITSNIKQIFSSVKVNFSYIALLSLAIGIYIVKKYFFNCEAIFSFLEAILFLMVINACITDLKTMSIDYFLSYTILITCFCLNFQYISDKDFMTNIFTIIVLGLLLIFGQKLIKKSIIGGADVDFFLGMIFFFNGIINIILFILSSCVFGIFTKLILNFTNKKHRGVKEFPFLPGIVLAFYFCRYLFNYVDFDLSSFI